MEDLKVKEPDWERLEEIYNKLEFNSLLSKIPEDKLSNGENMDYEIKYKIIKNNDYSSIIEEIKKRKELLLLNFYLKMKLY